MKKLVSILCAFALVFGLAGCGQEKKPEKKVTITIAAAASLEKTFEETLIPRFEKKYPNQILQVFYRFVLPTFRNSFSFEHTIDIDSTKSQL